MLRSRIVRILLVEDEPDAARLIAKGLREQAYAVDVAGDAESALYQASLVDYDALVLDVGLPAPPRVRAPRAIPGAPASGAAAVESTGIVGTAARHGAEALGTHADAERRAVSGLDVCRVLRARGSHAPILMLTARDAVDARIAGLDAGADDYLVKPFAFGELLARLRALIRRGLRAPLPEQLDVAGLRIDTRSRRVLREGRELPLTSREYALLEFLARRAGQVVSRAEIAEHVWDERYDPFSNVIDVYVQRLRRKVDTPGADSIIRTRRGEGYQLDSGAAAGRAPDDAPGAPRDSDRS